MLKAQESRVPDKASPFTAVKWERDQPIVKFENEWYTLLKLEHLNAEKIIDFAKKSYGDKWQKRFSEDLVEVLTGMGYTPKAKVNLILKKDGKVIEKTGQMTEENRRLVWQNNQDQKIKSSGLMGNDNKADTASQPMPRPTSSEERLAKRLWERVDKNWEIKPEEGTANIRILLTKDGKPFEGKLSIHTEFIFSAQGRMTHNQGFNPNTNGRWIYEELDPGTYDLIIKGLGRFEGWEWRRSGVQVAAGETSLFEIDLDE